MQKLSLTISSQTPLTHNCRRLVLSGSGLPQIAPGQFVQLGIPGKYLRRPISVCGAAQDSLTLIYKIVGEGTKILSGMLPGQELEALLPLGRGFSADACKDSALLLGGGLGAAPLRFLCESLLSKGRKVSVILGFNEAADVTLVEDYRALGVEPVIVTLDGSAGLKGFVTDAPIPEHDFFYTCGPLPMMRAVCSALGGPGELSMEERMGCGAGFCYGCTIQTRKGPARVCADGPVFSKEDIIW